MNPDLPKILSDGEITVQGRLVDASNATLFCEITLGDDSLNAIYKPISGERPLWDFDSGNLASRERAAYLVSELLGVHLVPLTIVRDGPFGPGMVQQWIDVDSEKDLATYFKEDHPELRQVALFDAVINNTDRKIGHLLPDQDGRLFVCDHGVTFHHEDKLRTVLWQWAGHPLNESEIAALRAFLDNLNSYSTEELKRLVSAVEYSALIARVHRLIEEGVMPEPSPDWPAIPWPPF